MLKKITYVLTAAYLFGGCVVTQPAPRNSRYGVDLTEMKQVDFLHDTWVYRHPSIPVRDYPALHLTSVEIFPNPVKQLSSESRARYDKLSRLMAHESKKMMEKDFKVADSLGPDVLSLRVAIIDMKPIVNLKKDGHDAVHIDTNAKGSKLELDAVDAQSKERIFGISTLLKGEAYARFEDPDFPSILEKETVHWMKFLGNRLKSQK